ncbi:hypothetical protein [Ensifer aridi]|uniref:hypothetical protein n=1 Tax=Ensifer aridi TaxID=1708715 RepID=UPI000A100C56|nr:hypothetical protein [Ensifer aridi]
MDLSLTFGRFIAGALISALLAIGGVWAVVQIAVSGVNTAVEATNARVGDIQARLTRLEDKIDDLQREVIRGFHDTQEEMKKASLEGEGGVLDFPTASVDNLKSRLVTYFSTGDQPRTVFLPDEQTLERLSQKVSQTGLESLASSISVPGLVSETDLFDKAKGKEGGYTLKTLAGGEITAKVDGENILISVGEGAPAPVRKTETVSPSLMLYETAQ